MSIVRKKLSVAVPEDFEGMTLMRMRTENIKRVRLVDLTVTEPLTLVGGDNSNGKTSFLDSLGWLLGGKEAIQMDPIHHGKQSGSIMADFGDGKHVKLTATRTLKRVGDDDWTSDIELEIPGHISPTAIQSFLNKLAGEMSFDPMAFDRLTDAERFDAMQKFVTGFDFKKHAADRKELFDDRTDVNRDQRREQGAADAIVLTKSPPSARIDEAALAEELRLAGDKNLDIERRRSNRQKAVDAIEAAKGVQARTDEAIARAKLNAEAIRDREVSRLREQIHALERQMATVRSECDDTIRRESDQLRAQATAIETEAGDLQVKLDAAGPLADEVDTTAIAARIAEARASNKLLDDWEAQRRRHEEHQKKADELAQASADLTAQIDALDAAKDKAIREAQMPVEGLGFGDGYITLRGPNGAGPVPWSQAGTAERMDASTAIAMALNPKLKVILIRDGSNLGKTIRERIRQRASERGYRVLMEVVEEGGGTHVVIEDGVVKQAAGAAA